MPTTARGAKSPTSPLPTIFAAVSILTYASRPGFQLDDLHQHSPVTSSMRGSVWIIAAR
jgi:hypothetical protein